MLKKDCDYTRKSLRKYLLGHLFTHEQKKIERHLKKCAFCSTDYQALRRSAETRKLLKDITPPEGVVQRVRAGVSVLSVLKRLLYRPLWIAGFLAAAAALYLYVIAPLYHDRELESIEAAAPQAAPAEPVLAEATAPRPQPAPAVPKPAAQAPAREPLVVTITVEDEASAISRINAVMQGHAVLRNRRFSASDREITGSLTPKELLTLFNRIEPSGKIRYQRSVLESSPATESLPFVLRLNTVPAAPKAAAPGQPAAQKPAQAAPAETPQPSAARP
ncbi:MAG: hypothetical protein A2X56_05110 [Nitrospirae bacterium GWC2_57_13]|jgi:hypothetical protein|nr:MAG: hypothetical protein A2X56_05110 [Nitrospirae bacterium GWC2_57_13]OGW44967.1 MAG: hypothetical protein A2X57_06490 [Nitrospirae bacterium GWD2_57_8]HAS55384.1 hypothetical protein [Nitrospiraceae bacterium]